MLQDGVSGIDGHLVVGGVSIGESQVEADELYVNKGKDKLYEATILARPWYVTYLVLD